MPRTLIVKGHDDCWLNFARLLNS